jgi:hypothetical protein
VNRQIAGDFATMAVWTQFDALGDVAGRNAKISPRGDTSKSSIGETRAKFACHQVDLFHSANSVAERPGSRGGGQ